MSYEAVLYSVLAVLQVTESVKMWCALMLKTLTYWYRSYSWIFMNLQLNK